MKNFVILLSLLFATSTMSQTSGIIKYQESIKLEFEAPEGMDMSEILGNSITTIKELTYDGMKSVYRDSDENENDEIDMSNDEGTFQIKIKRDDTEDIYFTDLSNKQILHQTGFMGKEFLIQEKPKKLNWKITGDRIKYLGYVCQKATLIENSNEEDEDGNPVEQDIVAWFTSELPVPVGPGHYSQLPGAVLMVSVNDGKREIKATEVILSEDAVESITPPNKGKKVSRDEYEQIVAEKRAEMEKMSGGRHIMIRG